MSFVILAAMENKGDHILCRKLVTFRKPRKLRKFLTKEVKYRNTGNENSPFDDRVLKSSFSLKEIQNKGIYYWKEKHNLSCQYFQC